MSLLGHIRGTQSNDHSWAALGFSDRSEFKREYLAVRASSPEDADGPEPSQLTELYEVFRSLRTIITRVLNSDSTAVESRDFSHPLVRYHALIDAIVTGDSDGDIFVGYGPQHADRVPHTVNDYRLKYGNGNWITVYRAIDVESLKEQTIEELSSHDVVAEPDLFVRPLAPEGSVPLPEAVTSEQALQRAIRILSRFPAAPATHPDEEPSTDGIPAQELYDAIVSGADIEIEPPDSAETIPVEQPLVPDWRESPAALAAPQTEEEIDEFLTKYEKLTHLTKRVEPPNDVTVDDPIQIVALDYYEPIGQSGESSKHSYRILSIKDDEQKFLNHFRTRLRDFIYRRCLMDEVDIDFITVFPGHEASSLSPRLVELAKAATVETPIVYTELLERTKTVDRQRTKGSDSRWDVCYEPRESLRIRHQVPDATVLLIDDVTTSGSSMAAGAHLLREAGAKRVIGLALGLTQPHDNESVRTLKDIETGLSAILPTEP